MALPEALDLQIQLPSLEDKAGIPTAVTLPEDSRRVLVVDDDPVTGKLVCTILRKAGFQVNYCTSAEEGLKQYQQKFFPFLITDWIMPGMTGPELCKEIRQQDLDGYVYTILLTSRNSREDLISGLKAGADDYLTKPLDRAELLARMQTGLRILFLEHKLKLANREIQQLANQDGLTGCYNRCYLITQGPKEVSRAVRYRRSISVIMVDIDHFKRINDDLGHLAGDAVLKEFVSRLQGQIRKGLDWLARYGGEEFVIILPETTVEDAQKMAERMRMLLENKPFKLDNGNNRITASFGVCDANTLPANLECTFSNLIYTADNLLYRSKNEGRNKVTASIAE